MQSQSIARLLTAVTAAAFLTLTPALAQTDGEAGARSGDPQVEPMQEMDPRVSDEQRTVIRESVTALAIEPVAVDVDVVPGAVIPETVVLQPVTAEIVAAVPEFREHRFFVMPNNRIAIVHPTERQVVMVLD